MKHLLKRPSFYIGGTVGLFLFFLSLGMGLAADPNDTATVIGMRFVEITTLPIKLLLGPISHTLANLASIAWIFFLFGFITAAITDTIRTRRKT